MKVEMYIMYKSALRYHEKKEEKNSLVTRCLCWDLCAFSKHIYVEFLYTHKSEKINSNAKPK